MFFNGKKNTTKKSVSFIKNNHDLLDELKEKGIINKNIIEFDKASLIVDGQHISSTGLINIFEKSWEVTANIDEFELRLPEGSHLLDEVFAL